MFALIATLLAQSCSFEDVACFDTVAAYTVQASIFTPVSSQGGLAFESKRNTHDQSPDVTILVPVERDPDAPAIEVRRKTSAQVLFRVLNRGEVLGGGDQNAEAAFIGFGGDGAVFGKCRGASTGCYVLFQSGMAIANNGAFHGALTIGNVAPDCDGGTCLRDGGLMLQIEGTGKSNAQSGVFHGTTTAIDDFGNLILRDGWVYQQLRTADRGACYTSTVWDGQWHQPGGYGYDQDQDALVFRSASACAADGGIETVCTDKNAACSVAAQLAIIGARLTALEAR